MRSNDPVATAPGRLWRAAPTAMPASRRACPKNSNIGSARGPWPSGSPHLVLSHLSAATVLRLPLWRPGLEDVHLTRIGISGGRATPGRVVHRAVLAPSEIITVSGVRVTSMARTLVDLACTESMASAVMAADAALQRRWVSSPALTEALDATGHRRGAAAARRALRFADGRAESAGESMIRVTMQSLGLPPPTLQIRIYARTAHSSAGSTSDIPNSECSSSSTDWSSTASHFIRRRIPLRSSSKRRSGKTGSATWDLWWCALYGRTSRSRGRARQGRGGSRPRAAGHGQPRARRHLVGRSRLPDRQLTGAARLSMASVGAVTPSGQLLMRQDNGPAVAPRRQALSGAPRCPDCVRCPDAGLPGRTPRRPAESPMLSLRTTPDTSGQLPGRCPEASGVVRTAPRCPDDPREARMADRARPSTPALDPELGPGATQRAPPRTSRGGALRDVQQAGGLRA